jgi:rod shape-determining protein MreC
VPDFDATRRGRGRRIAWALGVLLLALFVYLLPASYKDPLRDGIRGTVLRPFLALQSRLAATRTAGDPARIRAQRDSLLAVVAAQSALAEENRRLRSALALRDRLGPSFVSAHVLRVGAAGAESTFLIDVGNESGVAVGSPVLSSEGLVGVVRSVSGGQAQVIDWTHPEFRASGMTADGEAHGMVEARRGRHREEDILVLTGAPFHTEIRIGRRIVTSGRGDLHPRGVPIGTVAGIDEADTGWRKSYVIRPAARPEGLVHVFVGVAGAMAGDYDDAFAPPIPGDTLPPSLMPPTRSDTAVQRAGADTARQ